MTTLLSTLVTTLRDYPSLRGCALLTPDDPLCLAECVMSAGGHLQFAHELLLIEAAHVH